MDIGEAVMLAAFAGLLPPLAIIHNMARKMQMLQCIFLNLRLKIAERISTVQATLNLMAIVARPIGCRH